MTTERYNPDIQILRGVAILIVFAFHLRPGLLASGYLGVDVFFVVSGYLMHTLYGGPGAQSAGGFWFRRARRILPAYFATLIVTTIAVGVIALPHELTEYVRHALYSIALMPNVGFWMDNSYFERASFKPVLHLWSLGVELQFYLLFPLIVWLHRKTRTAAALIAVLSFVACVLTVHVSPKTSFFLTPLRLWEFMIGFYAAGALMSERLANALRHKPLAGLGCLAVIALCSALTLTEFQHPSYVALAVTLATAGVIVFGLPATLSAGPIGRSLARIGDYSYSIYLVHFPVIMLWLYRPFKGNELPDTHVIDLLAIPALTAALSLLLFHAIEMPARRLAMRSYLPQQAMLAAAALVVVVVSSPIERSLFDQRRLAILDAWSDRGTYRCGKLARLTDPFSLSCDLTPAVPRDARRFLLVGDSHADSIKDAMAEVAARHGARLRLMKENCALAKLGCTVAAVMREATTHAIGTIILHSSLRAMKADDIRELVRLGSAQGISVVLIHSVPIWPVNIMETLFKIAGGAPPATLPRQTADDYKAASDLPAATSAIKDPHFIQYAVGDLFCTPQCQTAADGRPLYFDGAHLTLTGSARLRPVFEAIFAGKTPQPR